jgi:hypothetical protein
MPLYTFLHNLPSVLIQIAKKLEITKNVTMYNSILVSMEIVYYYLFEVSRSHVGHKRFVDG